ncbi:MAG: YciI family protein [Polyangiaceae bacterium]
MSKFMYLFRRSSDSFKAASPEEMERLMKAWMTWLDTLRRDGHLVQTGERLEGDGKVVRGREKTVTDGPFVESKDTIGGYLLVHARDLEQATELAKGCPLLLALDGSVEVRQVVAA